MTPRVTLEGDIILDLLVENSTRRRDVNVAGQNSVVRLAQGRPRGCACATANRICWPGCFAKTSGEDAEGRARACSSCRCSTSCSPRTTTRSGPDRHRDAADAAHRADAGDHGSRSQPDLHRHPAEPRPRWPAAAHRAVTRAEPPARTRTACRRSRAATARRPAASRIVPPGQLRRFPGRPLVPAGAAPANSGATAPPGAACTPRLRRLRRLRRNASCEPRRSPPRVRKLS